jgi:hypothetical protein
VTGGINDQYHATCHMILDYDYREVFVFGNILQKVALKKDTILYLTCLK